MANKKRPKSKPSNEESMMEKKNKRLRVVATVALFAMVGTTAISMGLTSLGR